ncbi:ATP-binding cassette domain-containing protein [Clostridiales bacterium]|nr:ATP-binding cassette domain-containing protein [Clostridiales bacterium]
MKKKEGVFLIQLKNVSKFYYSKGMIASGFSRVNLNFDVGEFIVITGESGSGKSTLLNVISGLDSYEEGELYIEGKETSHYLASDFEEYRKKYIGNIFQHFNLVGSYTVYQNVALILRINGYKKKEIKEKVPAILKRVGMLRYAKTKVSKLSGGQKQRVSIARALAKETAIVVADEPTGNLDSESAEGIAQLLQEISKDKLVIVVTHNYDQFAPYATRKIKMHDGKVVEDEQLGLVQEEERPQRLQGTAGSISAASTLRLGLRNTFNIIPKFLLLLVVFLFVVVSVFSEYTTLKNSDEEAAKMGYNDYFSNYSENRVLLKRNDGKAFTDQDYQTLQTAGNVKSVVKEDILLDYMISLENEQFYYDAYPKNLNDFRAKLAAGRMPETSKEVILAGDENDYYLQRENMDQVLDKTYKITLGMGEVIKVKIVGIAYEESDAWWGTLYMRDAMLEKMVRESYGSSSKVTTVANDTNLVYEVGSQYYRPIASDKVKAGEAMVSEELNGYYKNGKAAGQEIRMKAENLFYESSIHVKIADTYNKKNFTAKTELKNFEDNDGAIFISTQDYRKLFTKENYQVTVYVNDVKEMDASIKAFQNMGYVPLALKDTLITMGSELVSIVQVPMAVFLVLAVFFIAYFVIQLILRSRSSYFSILRMLGLAKKSIRRILDVELAAVVNIAYGLFLAVIALVHQGVIQSEYLKTLADYMELPDYVILYGILLVMSYFISGKFARKLFKKTAMGSFREEE